MARLISYDRQREFDQVMNGTRGLNQYTQVIVGCGGVGFWLGVILAMQGYERFILVDGERVEGSNLNRLPVPPTWIGKKKVGALRKVIRTLRPETGVVVIGNHVSMDNIDVLGRIVEQGESFMVWDCTDDARIQRQIHKWAERHGNLSYRKIGYEGFKVGTYVNMGVWTEADYQPGYRTSNACAATSALAAVVGLFGEGLNVRGDVTVDFRKFLEGAGRREQGEAQESLMEAVVEPEGEGEEDEEE